MDDLGLRLKALRQEKKLTQEQAAVRANINRSTLSGYEQNTTRPTIDTLAQMALLYGVTTDYLLGLEKHKTVIIDDLTVGQQEIINLLLTDFRKRN